MIEDKAENLLELAERKSQVLAFWSNLIFQTHMFSTAISYILALVVPFGLALLLYIPTGYKETLNIILLSCSALSLVLQMLDHTMRFAERCRHGARLRSSIEMAIARFKDGRMTLDQFEHEVERVCKESAEEPWA